MRTLTIIKILFFLIIGLLSCKKDKKITNLSQELTIAPPLINPYLAESSWPITHANSYAQASVSYPGPITAYNI